MQNFQQVLIAEAEFDIIQAGLRFETGNNGVHLKVYKGRWCVADVWPTTQRYKLTDKGRIFAYSDLLAVLLFVIKINEQLEG